MSGETTASVTLSVRVGVRICVLPVWVMEWRWLAAVFVKSGLVTGVHVWVGVVRCDGDAPESRMKHLPSELLS